MPVNSENSKNYYIYIDDDGTTWQIKISDNMATNGGFAPVSQAEASLANIWPFPQKNLRHVWVSFPGSMPRRKSMFVPIASELVTLWRQPGPCTVIINNQPVQGVVSTKRGEVKRLWRLPGFENDSEPA